MINNSNEITIITATTKVLKIKFETDLLMKGLDLYCFHKRSAIFCSFGVFVDSFLLIFLFQYQVESPNSQARALLDLSSSSYTLLQS